MAECLCKLYSNESHRSRPPPDRRAGVLIPLVRKELAVLPERGLQANEFLCSKDRTAGMLPA